MLGSSICVDWNVSELGIGNYYKGRGQCASGFSDCGALNREREREREKLWYFMCSFLLRVVVVVVVVVVVSFVFLFFGLFLVLQAGNGGCGGDIEVGIGWVAFGVVWQPFQVFANWNNECVEWNVVGLGMGMLMMGLVNVHWASQIGVLNPKREREKERDDSDIATGVNYGGFMALLHLGGRCNLKSRNEHHKN